MNLEGQIAGEAYIQKLPENVLLEIMQYVSMGDRFRARRVCKSWNQILSGFSSWKHVDLLEYRLDLKTLWKIVRTHLSPCLLTLKIRGYTYADISNRGKISLSNALLKKLSACCPKLRLLHLSDCKTYGISFESLPPSITCLEVVYNKWRPQWMKNKQMHLPNLVHLVLDNTKRVDDFDMEDIVFWKNLKYLSLKGCSYVGASGVKTIAEHLLELEFLHLFYVRLNDMSVHHIVQNLKKLKELYLPMCRIVTDKALSLIAMGLPVLNKLDISECKHVTMRGLESLFRSKLSVLIVDKSTCLTEVEKQTLKKDFPESFILVT